MRSDNVTKGSERAPNRSLFYALGYTPEELDRPLIGVVSAYSEIVPGHAHLDKIADAVKAGVRMAGGTPILIPAIGVCDGIAMGHVGMKYSLASRELICDSVETMFMAHQLDGLVLVIVLFQYTHYTKNPNGETDISLSVSLRENEDWFRSGESVEPSH